MKNHTMNKSEINRAAVRVCGRLPLGAVVAVVVDASTSGIVHSLLSRCVTVYRIPSGKACLVTPEGAIHKLNSIWPGNPARADVLISGCTFYSSAGGISVRYARTAGFISNLKRKGFFYRNSLLQIAVASPAQHSEIYNVKSKFAFVADTIIGPDGEIPLRKQHGSVVSPENFFRLLLRGYQPDRLPDIEDARSACYGKTKQIVDEELGAVDASELGIAPKADTNNMRHQ